jgi:hypothetical protein
VALYLLFFFKKMNRWWVGMGLAGLVATSILSYAGSALVLGLFIPAFSLAVLWRRGQTGDTGRAIRTASWSLAGALIAVSLFYVQYIPELLPGLADPGSASAKTEGLIDLRMTPWAALVMATHRIHIFYGPIFGVLLFASLLVVRRQFSGGLGLPLLSGALVAFFGLNFLRSGLGDTHIFQFSKDDLVLLPVAAVAFGALVDLLAERGRLGRFSAAAVLVGWVAWGCGALVRDVQIRFVRPDYPPQVVVSPQATSHPGDGNYP